MLQRLLAAADVRFVRLLWCDNANLVRAKVVPVAEGGLIAAGVPVTAAAQSLPVMYDAVVPDSGLTPVGEAVLTPDWDTLAVLPFAPGQAHVLCDLTVDGRPWEHCPRAFLRDRVDDLAGLGLRALAGFETELVLMRRTDDGLVPADRTTYAQTAPLNDRAGLVDDLAAALAAQGTPLALVHGESGPGQLELSVHPDDPLATADHQVGIRESVRGTAPRHGLLGSFLPVLGEDVAGSGCHLNLSLWRDDRDVTGDAARASSMSVEAEAFVAGLLHHLPGLCALTLATPNSYRRIRPHYWAGAYTAWGRGNREAAVRVSTDADGAAVRLELKFVDATANPYLALGAALAAGADGIREGLVLPPEVTVDPGTLDDDERDRVGAARLPTDLGVALTGLRDDEVLLAALGAARARAYLAVKDAEWEGLRELSLADEVALLAERY
jgi:glutamine synthetase